MKTNERLLKAVARRRQAKLRVDEFLRCNQEYQRLMREFRKADDAYGRAIVANLPKDKK